LQFLTFHPSVLNYIEIYIIIPFFIFTFKYTKKLSVIFTGNTALFVKNTFGYVSWENNKEAVKYHFLAINYYFSNLIDYLCI